MGSLRLQSQLLSLACKSVISALLFIKSGMYGFVSYLITSGTWLRCHDMSQVPLLRPCTYYSFARETPPPPAPSSHVTWLYIIFVAFFDLLPWFIFLCIFSLLPPFELDWTRTADDRTCFLFILRNCYWENQKEKIISILNYCADLPVAVLNLGYLVFLCLMFCDIIDYLMNNKIRYMYVYLY